MSAKPIARICVAKVVKYFELSKKKHKKNAIHVRKHKWRFCRNLNKTHFFGFNGLEEFSRSSQGRLSVKLGNGSRNEKKTNLNNCYFLQKIPTALLNGILFSERAKGTTVWSLEKRKLPFMLENTNGKAILCSHTNTFPSDFSCNHHTFPSDFALQRYYIFLNCARIRDNFLQHLGSI